MAKSLWVKATLSVAGTPLNAVVCRATFDLAYNPILVAGSDGSPLLGYSPGNGNAGFAVRAHLPPASAAAVMNAALDIAGVPVAVQYGDAGGAHATLAFLTDMSFGVSGAGATEWNATFLTTTPPTIGGTVGTVAGRAKPFLINDLTSATCPTGAIYTKLAGATFTIKRPPSEFRGNSPFGLPQDLDVPYTLVTYEAHYEKTDDVEATAAVTLPRVIADGAIVYTQVDSTTPVTLTFTIKDAFHLKLPEPSGNTTDFIAEMASMASDSGTFTIA